MIWENHPALKLKGFLRPTPNPNSSLSSIPSISAASGWGRYERVSAKRYAAYDALDQPLGALWQAPRGLVGHQPSSFQGRPMNALSTAAAALYEAINSATSPDEPDNVLDAIWRRHWPVGAISDDEAQFLAEAIQKRKPQRGFVAESPVGKLHARVSLRLGNGHVRRIVRPRGDRRRTLGSSSAMPPAMRAKFTEGQRAVLAIVAGEIKHHGVCDLPYDSRTSRPMLTLIMREASTYQTYDRRSRSP